MPELPEITVYVEALADRIAGAVLENVRVRSISLLRTYDPPLEAVCGATVTGVSRLGKRIVIESGDFAVVVHLMVAGRLRWRDRGAAIPGKIGLAAFDFTTGTVLLTEAGTKRRASLHLLRRADLAALDPGGIDIATAGGEEFAAALVRERHTLKRSLTDARLFDGIGGAFADEILHRARLSPLQMSDRLDATERDRLHEAARAVLAEWTERRRIEAGDAFPEQVSAFHPDMAVHGKYGRPCPVCGTPVQRIVYASRETNYCPQCQTGGRVLADRALSRLLKDDWPGTVEELEGD
jgi:formamidopyrimidine-DNA glycosylase